MNTLLKPTQRARRIATNTLESYHAGKLELFPQTERIVITTFQTVGTATDRDIALYLDYDDLNRVRPRITALLERGIIEKCGDTVCPFTGRTVRLCRLAQPEDKAQLLLSYES